MEIRLRVLERGLTAFEMRPLGETDGPQRAGFVNANSGFSGFPGLEIQTWGTHLPCQVEKAGARGMKISKSAPPGGVAGQQVSRRVVKRMRMTIILRRSRGPIPMRNRRRPPTRPSEYLSCKLIPASPVFLLLR